MTRFYTGGCLVRVWLRLLMSVSVLIGGSHRARLARNPGPFDFAQGRLRAGLH